MNSLSLFAGMKVVFVPEGHEHYPPEPNSFMASQTHLYFREEEKDVILEQIRKVSYEANLSAQ